MTYKEALARIAVYRDSLPENMPLPSRFRHFVVEDGKVSLCGAFSADDLEAFVVYVREHTKEG